MSDYVSLYKCVDCMTKRYLIFPQGRESFIICSACYRIRQEKEEKSNEK